MTNPFNVEEASGKSYCRGENDCIYRNRYGRPIPKGELVLRISIRGAGGSCYAIYCGKCMNSVIKSFLCEIKSNNL